MADTDGDGIDDQEEMMGIYESLTGNDTSLVLPWQHTGTNVNVPDLFVEIDYMQNTGNNAHNHDPRIATNWNTFQADLERILENDSGWSGRTVRPHIMVSQGFAEVDRVSFANCGSGTLYFYDRKSKPWFFDPLRASVFHYVIVGHRLKTTDCSDEDWSGQAEIWGNDALVTLGAFTANVGTVNQQRGTFIHELGHNLALVHNGNGSNSGANSCIHASPMNYRYQMVGTGVAGANGLRTWSYSRGSCDTSGIGACTNTCVTFSGRQCVPTNQTSPKAGCNPNTAGCDCDNAEWANMNLDIPANDPMSYVACQISNCSGSDGLGRDPARELTARAMRRYFLGQDDGVLGQVRALARERKRLLVQKGLRDGVDFVEDLATGRLYSRE